MNNNWKWWKCRAPLIAALSLVGVISAAPGRAELSLELGTSPKQPQQNETHAAVIDLCQIPAPHADGGYAKQRVVIFDLAGEEVTNEPEREVDDRGQELPGVQHHVFRTISAHNHLRNVFFGTFPMERLHSVPAKVVGPQAATGGVLSNEQMIRAAELDPFAAYSIACADWVMVPRISRKNATWSRVTRERQRGKKTEKYKAWDLDLSLTVEVAAYRFEEGQWRLKDTISADAGLLSFATSLNMLGDATNQLVKSFGGDETREPTGMISAAPEPSCQVPLVDDVKEVADGFGKCGQATAEATASAGKALEMDDEEIERRKKEEERLKAEEAAKESGDDGASDTAGDGDETADDKKKNSAKGGKGASSGDKPVNEGKQAERKQNDTAPNKDDDQADDPEAEELAEPEADLIDDVGRETLSVMTSKNPQRGIQELAQRQLEDGAPQGMVDAVKAAKTAVDTCKTGVETVVKVSDKLRSLVSKSPTALAKDAALGFAACVGIPLTYDLGNATPPGTTQLRSPFCKDINDDVARGAAAMHDVALCVARVGSEQSTLMAQKEVKALDGIAVVLPLLAVSGPTPGFGIAIGREEGINRGDMFVAGDGSFGYIVLQGPGGNGGAGVREPSHFKFRAGEAPVGSSMREYPKVGALLGGRPQYGLLLVKDNMATNAFMGGAIEGGYNAGQFVSVGDEFWVRANVGLMIGQGDETFLNIEALPEAQYYLFSRVAGFIQSGVAMNIVSKSVPGVGGNETLSGVAYSVLLGLGLDVALNPDWNLRVAALGSQGLTELKLEDKNKTRAVEAGRLTSAQGTASLSYSF